MGPLVFSLCAALPRGIGVGEIHRKIGGEGEGGVPAISVPWSQVSNLRRCAGRSLTAPERASLIESARPRGRATGHRYRLPLHQGAYRRFTPLPDDQVTFSVAGHLAACDLGGPVLDGARADDLRAEGLLAAAGFPLLAPGAQDNPGTLRLSFRVGVDPGVNGLV